jgi:hypothetical protein
MRRVVLGLVPGPDVVRREAHSRRELVRREHAVLDVDPVPADERTEPLETSGARERRVELGPGVDRARALALDQVHAAQSGDRRRGVVDRVRARELALALTERRGEKR